MHRVVYMNLFVLKDNPADRSKDFVETYPNENLRQATFYESYLKIPLNPKGVEFENSHP